MAVRPEDILPDHPIVDTDRVSQFETEVDVWLREQDRTKQEYVYSWDFPIPQVDLDALAALYREAGWQAEAHSHADGRVALCTLTLKRPLKKTYEKRTSLLPPVAPSLRPAKPAQLPEG